MAFTLTCGVSVRHINTHSYKNTKTKNEWVFLVVREREGAGQERPCVGCVPAFLRPSFSLIKVLRN